MGSMGRPMSPEPSSQLVSDKIRTSIIFNYNPRSKVVEVKIREDLRNVSREYGVTFENYNMEQRFNDVNLALQRAFADEVLLLFLDFSDKAKDDLVCAREWLQYTIRRLLVPNDLDREKRRTALKVSKMLMARDPELALHPQMHWPAPTFLQSVVKCKDLSLLETVTMSLMERRCCSAPEALEALDSPRQGNGALYWAIQFGYVDLALFLLSENPSLGRAANLLKSALSCNSDELIDSLIESNDGIASPGFARDIIDGLHIDTWLRLCPHHQESFLQPSQLARAVSLQILKIVEDMIRRKPSLALELHDGYHILYYNNTCPKPKDRPLLREEIRALLVPEIIKAKPILEIEEILKKSQDEPRELSLDLSKYHPASYEFSDFVRSSLSTDDGTSKDCYSVRFESVLRYVTFPNLQTPLQERFGQQTKATIRAEARSVMKWLKDKGVKTILRLIVPDCLYFPHPEGYIAECVEDLSIRYLDWRKVDLCIDAISCLKESLEELHLYCSGNWAVIRHWAGADGLRKLDKLNRINIHIVKNLAVPSSEDVRGRLVSWLELEDPIEMREVGDIDMTTTEGTHQGKKISITMMEWQFFEPGRTESPDSREEKRQIRHSLHLDYFYRQYTDLQQQRDDDGVLRPTKVAIIDNGVFFIGSDATSEEADLKQRIKDGITFVPHEPDIDRANHWWLPSRSHGTHMANIICGIDPFCELYVARVVAEHESGSSAMRAENIAKAIDWAREKKVDIISISLVLFEQGPLEMSTDGRRRRKLENAVNAAKREDIVIICSTADKGNNTQQIWPAQYDGTISISASDIHGKITDWSSSTKAAYSFLGKDVCANKIPFMKSQSTISGSSVATAIAAGVASAILACCRIRNNDRGRNWKIDKVKEIFSKMKPEAQQPYTQPSKLLGPQNFAENTGLVDLVDRHIDCAAG